MTQTQQQPKDRGVQYGENTLFLCPDDKFEMGIAQAYIKAKYPGTPAGLFTEIPLDALNSSHTIITLVRPSGSTEAWTTIVKDGREDLAESDPKSVALEVFEGEPIPVRDHWIVHSKQPGRQNGLGGSLALGAVNWRSLSAALSNSEKCLRDPWCIKPLQSIRMLRIGQ